MMTTKVFVCTDTVSTRLNPYGPSVFARIFESARAQDGSDYQLASSAEEADLIYFIEPRDYYQTNLLRSPFYRKFKSRLVVFTQQDHSIPRIPGIYTRIPTSLHDIPLYEYGFYCKVFDFCGLDDIPIEMPRKYLFSFMGNGRAAADVRKQILSLQHPNCLLVDSATAFSGVRESYEKSIAESYFVLCPRGLGPSSFRLFEAMRAGRVPVIVSDEWRPISGIDWNAFSLQVSQNQITELPGILGAHVDRAVEMGLRARQVYNLYFSREMAFKWLVSTGLRLIHHVDHYQDRIFRGLMLEGIRYGQVKSTLEELIRNCNPAHRKIKITLHS